MHNLYYAACQADDAFEIELLRVYGVRRSSDMRYRTREYTDVALMAACHAKHVADAAWLNAASAKRTQESGASDA